MRLLSMIDASLTRDFGANKLWRWQWDLPSRQRKFYSLNIGNIKMWKITNSSWRTIHHVKLRRSQRISRDIVDWLRLAGMEGETRILNANPNDKCLSNQFWKSYRSARSLVWGWLCGSDVTRNQNHFELFNKQNLSLNRWIFQKNVHKRAKRFSLIAIWRKFSKTINDRTQSDLPSRGKETKKSSEKFLSFAAKCSQYFLCHNNEETRRFEEITIHSPRSR